MELQWVLKEQLEYYEDFLNELRATQGRQFVPCGKKSAVRTMADMAHRA